jgi:hypothetical protein
MGRETSRHSYFLDNRLIDRGEVSLKHQQRFTLQEDS